jgi:hemoglobin-like flavoprotein
MGAIISSRKEVKEEELVVKFPSYYVEAEVTADDVQRARDSWALIVEDTSAEYQAQKSMIQSSSCVAWFYDLFYERLFQVAPTTKPLFKNDMQVQGKALVKMISAALGLLNDVASLTDALQGLARGHAAKGVVSAQYGIVGEVMLWTLKKVLGEHYTPEVEGSWLRIYCFMIKVIIPAAVEEEKKIREESKKKK